MKRFFSLDFFVLLGFILAVSMAIYCGFNQNLSLKNAEKNQSTKVVEKIYSNGFLIGQVIERDGKQYILNTDGGIVEIKKENR